MRYETGIQKLLYSEKLENLGDAFGPISDARVSYCGMYIAQDECNYRWATNYVHVSYGDAAKEWWKELHTYTKLYICTQDTL